MKTPVWRSVILANKMTSWSCKVIQCEPLCILTYRSRWFAIFVGKLTPEPGRCGREINTLRWLRCRRLRYTHLHCRIYLIISKYHGLIFVKQEGIWCIELEECLRDYNKLLYLRCLSTGVGRVCLILYIVLQIFAFYQSLTKVAVLPVIRSGFYEDQQKFTLCRSECPTQFFSNTN